MNTSFRSNPTRMTESTTRRPSVPARLLGLALAFVGGCRASPNSAAIDASASGDANVVGVDARVDANLDASVDARADANLDAGRDAALPGPPTAQALLAKLTLCSGTTLHGAFGLDGPGSLTIDACGSAAYWTADLDVDCDGIQTPPCNTDPTGQPQTSIVDLAPTGDVDPTVLPYFVIPLGSPQSTWYTSHGIELGQVGAVIYGGQVRYGIFADEAGGAFIGEASYAMCQLFLGPPSGGQDPCSPINGGIDPAQVTYVTFTGPTARATGSVIYDHAAHVTLGIAAANAWLAEP